MKSLQEIAQLRESLRLGINDKPEEYNFEDFIDKNSFILTFYKDHVNKTTIRLNWIKISKYEPIDQENNKTNIKGKVTGYNDNAYSSMMFQSSPIHYVHPENEFICLYQQDKFFSNVVDITMFFNPKFNSDIISNLLNELLKATSSNMIEYSIKDIFDMIGIDGSDFKQYAGNIYNIKGIILFKKTGIKDIISNLSIVKESLRIGINDQPEEDITSVLPYLEKIKNLLIYSTNKGFDIFDEVPCPDKNHMLDVEKHLLNKGVYYGAIHNNTIETQMIYQDMQNILDDISNNDKCCIFKFVDGRSNRNKDWQYALYYINVDNNPSNEIFIYNVNHFPKDRNWIAFNWNK